MKKVLLLASFAFLLTSLSAQKGIQFNKGSWEEILADAKEQDKLIFLDAYTSWCGPCKWMAANAFPDKAVGEYFNSTFVNAKIDMEKGEGPAIAKTYEVRAYPTLLFVDGDGNLVHRSVGGTDAAGLINLAKDAIDPNKQIGPMIRRFREGDRDPEFLKTYALAASAAYMPEAKDVANAYFKTQADLLTEENIKLIVDNTSSEEDAYFDFMVKNRAKFGKVLGDDFVNASIINIMAGKYYRTNDLDFSKVTEQLSKVYSAADAEKYTAAFKMTYYQYRSRTPAGKVAYLNAAIAYMDKYSSDNPDELNKLAWSVYESTDDAEILKKACKWAQKSVKLDENFHNMDTLAHICHKLGKKGRAKKLAKKAIAIGKSAGEDVSVTEDLLKKIG